MSSSIIVTLRLFVQPVEAQDTAQVSGISREATGPDRSRSLRMSRRERSLWRSQLRVRSWVGLQRLLQLFRPVRRAQAAPEDEVGVRRDGCGRIDLQQRQSLDHREQALGPRRVEQLGANGDAPRLRLRQAMHRRQPNGGWTRGSVGGTWPSVL
jgi:hypothetical protein